jgi:hypothetical protein
LRVPSLKQDEEKNHGQTQGESTPQHNTRHKYRSQEWCPTDGPQTTKRDDQSVDLQFSCSNVADRPIFFHHVRLRQFTTISTKRRSRAVARCGSADEDDVASPNYFLEFLQFLNNVFSGEWIVRGGPTAWPAPSSDLNPLHFHIRKYFKSTVCATEASDFQD